MLTPTGRSLYNVLRLFAALTLLYAITVGVQRLSGYLADRANAAYFAHFYP